MAIAFRIATVTEVTSTPQVVTKPTGTVDGDVIFIHGPNLSPVAGWTSIGTQIPFALVKVASGEPSSWSFSSTGTVILCSVYSGSGGFGNSASALDSGTSHSVPSISIASDGSKVVCLAVSDPHTPDTDNSELTAPTGWVEQYDLFPDYGTYWAGGGVFDKAVGAGASGATTYASVVSNTTYYTVVVELIPQTLSGTIASDSSSLTANLLVTGELGGSITSASELTLGTLVLSASLSGSITSASVLSATMTGIPNLDFTVYDAYIDDGTNVTGYIFHDTDQSRAADQSLRLQPVRQDVGNNPAEIRPESGDLFAQSDFSHGDGQEYFHHTGRDPRRFLHSEGFDISVPGKLTHLHQMLSASGATAMGDMAIADGLPFYSDGTDLYVGNGSFPGTWTAEDWDATEARTTITSLASSGSDLYVAAGTNGIHLRTGATDVWTHYVNDTAALGFSKIAWVKNRLMAVSGTAVYEITAGGALPTAIETMAPGWAATKIFESGGFIYICWVNTAGGLSQVNHYGLNSGATAIEKKGSTPLPQGQFATGGRGYLNTIFIGVGRLNSDGGYDPVLYQGVADATGIIDYVKVVEEKGSGAVDLSVSVIEPFGEAVLYGWSLRSGASTGVAREGLGIFHLGLGAHAHHFSTGNTASRKITSLVIYKGRVLLGVDGVGVYYEDPTTFVAQAEMMPSVADWSNAGLKVWDRLEIAHRPLVAGTSVTMDFTTTHPDEADWDSAIASSTVAAEGKTSTLATAISRLFDVRIRSNATTAKTAAPTVLGFAVRSNPAPATPEFQITRTIRLFARDRKDDRGETLDQDPDAMRAALQALAYRWVKLYEPDTTWTARIEGVATLEPLQPQERVTAGEASRSGYIMQIVLSGTRD